MVSKRQLIYGIGCCLFVIASLWRKVDLKFMIIIVLWILLMGYCFLNYEKNIVTINFLITFFLFLLGGYFCSQYLGYNKNVVFFNDKITNHIYNALLLALMGIFCGIIGKFNLKLGQEKKENKEYSKIIKQISKIGYFVTYFPYMLSGAFQIFVSKSQGYEGIYLTDTSSMLPYWFRLVAYSCPVFFYLFLATLPSKAEVRIPTFLFIIYTGITLMTGQRSTFVINIMLILIYFVLRNNSNEKWIDKKLLLLLIAIAPIAIIGLNFIGYIRFKNESANYLSGIETLLDAFTSQGVSISVIGYGKFFEQMLPKKIYSFGGMIEFFKYNPITSIFYKFDSYSGQNVFRAMNGNLFSHAISYLVLPWGYVHGRGLGSCYIAEAYHDFGYIGVFLISFVYGKILRFCNSFNKKSIMTRFIILNMQYAILMAPRGLADAFISNLFNIQIWIVLGSVIAISNILYWKNNEIRSGSKLTSSF